MYIYRRHPAPVFTLGAENLRRANSTSIRQSRARVPHTLRGAHKAQKGVGLSSSPPRRPDDDKVDGARGREKKKHIKFCSSIYARGNSIGPRRAGKHLSCAFHADACRSIPTYITVTSCGGQYTQSYGKSRLSCLYLSSHPLAQRKRSSRQRREMHDEIFALPRRCFAGIPQITNTEGTGVGEFLRAGV